MSKVHIPPDGAVLHSIANANQRWSVVLGEWIDNAFDADAKTIAVEFGDRHVRITDDGRGCVDPIAMVRLGSHERHASTKLGRYGIGGKEASLWVGGMDSTVRITTTHGGVLRKMTLNWKEYAENWMVDEPSSFEVGAEHESGTEIVVRPVVKKPPAGDAWMKLLDELGYWYSPALKQGRQIKFKRPLKRAEWEPLKRWELPPFQGEVVNERIVVNGQGARVYCGIVQDGTPNPRSGFTYVHEWRVIEAASAKGCGPYSPARICGFVELDSTWKLTKNKDAIAKDAADLYIAVERVCAGILKKADSIGLEVRSQQFLSAASEQLNALIHTNLIRARAKRHKGESVGTIQPVATERKHTRAAVEQPGNTFDSRDNPRSGGRWRIDYTNEGVADSIGHVTSPNVLLNRDNPMVEQLRKEQETSATVVLASCLITVEHLWAPNGQPLLPGIDKGISPRDFSRAVGSILAGKLQVDGKPAIKIA